VLRPRSSWYAPQIFHGRGREIIAALLAPLAILTAVVLIRHDAPRASALEVSGLVTAAAPAPDWHDFKELLPTPTPEPTRAPQAPPAHAGAAGGASCTATYFSGARGAYGPLVGLFAAHRSYPGGTKLRVARGGRSVIVTVLDYGPAAWTGHCIDLAPAAFSQLGPLSAGVIGVTVSRA
jgi:rare lipoprotein A